MLPTQNIFFLLKSDPKASSVEVGSFIRKFPGVKEVWMTEGEYSFLAKFAVPEGTVGLLTDRISRNPKILELSCLTAPISL